MKLLTSDFTCLISVDESFSSNFEKPKRAFSLQTQKCRFHFAKVTFVFFCYLNSSAGNVKLFDYGRKKLFEIKILFLLK